MSTRQSEIRFISSYNIITPFDLPKRGASRCLDLHFRKNKQSVEYFFRVYRGCATRDRSSRNRHYQRGVIRTWVYGFGTGWVRFSYGLVTVWLRFGYGPHVRFVNKAIRDLLWP